MGRGTLWSSRTVLDAEPASVSRVRQFVARHLAEHELSSLAEDVELAASELATMGIALAPSAFTLTLLGVETSVVLTVRLGPPAAGLRRSAPVRRAAPVTDTEARGFAVVRLVSRDCGVNVGADGVESVWASFDVPSAGT